MPATFSGLLCLSSPCDRAPGPTSLEELCSSRVSGFQPSTSRSPGMIT